MHLTFFVYATSAQLVAGVELVGMPSVLQAASRLARPRTNEAWREKILQGSPTSPRKWTPAASESAVSRRGALLLPLVGIPVP